ncbi:MAG TPA: phosphatidylinositol mannoside acyltransferase [Jatrophihabitans sp.]|nr:phosphatidylinositol mannoside acyltransferase [Jatrophihabitans sp.]
MSLLGPLRQHAGPVGYGLAWRGVRLMPAALAGRTFDQVADLVTRRNGPSIRQLRTNLDRATGRRLAAAELDALTGRAMRSYARYWMETFRLPSMNLDDVAARANTTGWEHVQAAVAAGRGVILALPHSGNWEVAGIWLIKQGYPFTTVAERLRPESLFDQFVAYREGLGMRVLPLTGGQRPPMDVLAERLRAGEVVCLLADRDLSRRGVEVNFFGEPTRMPPGPALLAATTGAALLPVHCSFRADGWEQWVGPPVELTGANPVEAVPPATQHLADAFAGRIAERPQDWHMLQKLWLADLDQARLRRAGAAEPA